MATKNVADVVAKWSRNTAASVPSIKAGVMAVKVAPGQRAAAQAELYARKVQESVDSGKFQAGCQSVSLQEWQRLTAEKGTARIAQGVKEAEAKQMQFYGALLPFTAQLSDEIQAMPKGTEADADARLMAAVNRMRQFKYKKKA